MKPIVLIVLAVMICGCNESPVSDPETTTPEKSASAPGLPPSSISLNNQGVGEMGAFDYGKARATFAELAEMHPDDAVALANLAIATLNRQNPGDEALALEIIDRIETLDSANPVAHYLAGILRFNAGEIARAQEHFSAVVALDPKDAYARYFLGQCQVQQGQLEEALTNFIAASEMDPYLRSAFYGAFLALQRSGDREEARRYLDIYQRLEKNPRSRLAEIKYTKMGPKAMAQPLRHGNTPAAGEREGQPPPWSSRPYTPLVFQSAPLSAVAMDAGGVPLLLIPDTSGLRVLHRDSGEEVTTAITGVRDVLSIAVGDFNNDTTADVYLGRDGEDQLWKVVDGVFMEWPLTLLAETRSASFQVMAIDADHDGDLDVLRRGDGPVLMNNDGDGSFRSLDIGLPEASMLTAADIDADRDLDIVYNGGWLANDRMWDYQSRMRKFDALSLSPADLDSDGLTEICGLSQAHVRCEEFDGNEWSVAVEFPLSAPAVELSLIDWTADGTWEFLVVGSDAWAVFEPSGVRLVQNAGRVLAIGSSLTDDGPVPAIWVGTQSGVEQYRPDASRYIALEFAGRTDVGQSMRSNTSGIGARYVLRTSSQWTAGMAGINGSSPSSAPGPVLIGVTAPIEYLEVDWSDGVFQSELSLVAGAVNIIEETQRQLASCPVLFVLKDGQYQYVSDVLGVGGIGFATGLHTYATPRPRESFLLSPEQVDLTDEGRLSLYFTEPMEESAYLDAVTVQVIDVDSGHELTLDERMATDGKQPSGEPMRIQQLLHPRSLVNQDGEDVGSQARAMDAVAIEPPQPDPRFLGFLSSEHTLILTFDQDLGQLPSPALIMDGWVEYGYSQTSFAAWQADMELSPPSLERWDESADEWVMLRERFGYPAGMPRKSTLLLDPLPPNTHRLRLKTNQQIYFDRLAIAQVASVSPDDRSSELRPRIATLQSIGFPRRIQHPQFRPDYDFSQRTPFWDVNYQTGFYSAYGDLSELLQSADGALAIVGPGDGLKIEFDVGALPAPAAGVDRYYLLSFDGWAKDRDMFTQTGETVNPVPGVRDSRAQALHDGLNTRFQSGR